MPGRRRRAPDLPELLAVVRDVQNERVVVVAFDERGIDRRGAPEVEHGVPARGAEQRAQVRVPRVAVHRRDAVVHAFGVVEPVRFAQLGGLQQVARIRLAGAAAAAEEQRRREQREQREADVRS
jgi:hypothetical protein